MKIEGAVLALASGILLSSCDKAGVRDTAPERAEKAYQTAVADYTAGRIDAAIDGFTKAVRDNPGNISARFQLAVLMQDRKKDYLAAMCNYADCILLDPDSQKSRLAAARLGECEKLLADVFAKKYNLGDSEALIREMESLKGALEESSKAADAGNAKAKTLEAKLATLERENARLKDMLKRVGDSGDEDGVPARTPAVARPAVVHDIAEDDVAKRPEKVTAPPAEEEEKPLTLNPEALALFEAEEKEGATRPQTLPERPAAEPAQNANRLTDLVRGFGRSDETPAKETAQRFHIVEEGETLSMIAQKYYGRKSAWRKIQDANKAAVSTDGKVNAGQRLVIP